MSDVSHMRIDHDGFFLSTDAALLDLDVISGLLTSSYWATDRPREVIAESIKHSLCFGVYRAGDGKQVGFARVVTDRVTFSWVCDVIIAEEFRGRGLGTWLMTCVVEHPWVRKTKSHLGTRDAHGLYEKFGYERREHMRRPATKGE